MDAYIKIIAQAIEYNTKEIVENADNYTMREMFFMRWYTQALKDVLVDLKEYDDTSNSKYYTLRKFNLN